MAPKTSARLQLKAYVMGYLTWPRDRIAAHELQQLLAGTCQTLTLHECEGAVAAMDSSGFLTRDSALHVKVCAWAHVYIIQPASTHPVHTNRMPDPQHFQLQKRRCNDSAHASSRPPMDGIGNKVPQHCHEGIHSLQDLERLFRLSEHPTMLSLRQLSETIPAVSHATKHSSVTKPHRARPSPRKAAASAAEEIRHARHCQSTTALVKTLSWIREQGILELAESARVQCATLHPLGAEFSSHTCLSKPK